MKKITLFIAVAALAAFSFSGCKKCSTCTVYYTADNTVAYAYSETCGPKQTIEDYEKIAESTWVGSDYRVECTTK